MTAGIDESISVGKMGPNQRLAIQFGATPRAASILAPRLGQERYEVNYFDPDLNVINPLMSAYHIDFKNQSLEITGHLAYLLSDTAQLQIRLFFSNLAFFDLPDESHFRDFIDPVFSTFGWGARVKHEPLNMFFILQESNGIPAFKQFREEFLKSLPPQYQQSIGLSPLLFASAPITIRGKERIRFSVEANDNDLMFSPAYFSPGLLKGNFRGAINRSLFADFPDTLWHSLVDSGHVIEDHSEEIDGGIDIESPHVTYVVNPLFNPDPNAFRAEDALTDKQRLSVFSRLVRAHSTQLPSFFVPTQIDIPE